MTHYNRLAAIALAAAMTLSACASVDVNALPAPGN